MTWCPRLTDDSQALSSFFLILCVLFPSLATGVAAGHALRRTALGSRVGVLVSVAAVAGLAAAGIADGVSGLGHYWAIAGIVALFSLAISAPTAAVGAAQAPPGGAVRPGLPDLRDPGQRRTAEPRRVQPELLGFAAFGSAAGSRGRRDPQHRLLPRQRHDRPSLGADRLRRRWPRRAVSARRRHPATSRRPGEPIDVSQPGVTCATYCSSAPRWERSWPWSSRSRRWPACATS